MDCGTEKSKQIELAEKGLGKLGIASQRAEKCFATRAEPEGCSENRSPPSSSETHAQRKKPVTCFPSTLLWRSRLSLKTEMERIKITQDSAITQNSKTGYQNLSWTKTKGKGSGKSASQRPEGYFETRAEPEGYSGNWSFPSSSKTQAEHLQPVSQAKVSTRDSKTRYENQPRTKSKDVVNTASQRTEGYFASRHSPSQDNAIFELGVIQPTHYEYVPGIKGGKGVIRPSSRATEGYFVQRDGYGDGYTGKRSPPRSSRIMREHLQPVQQATSDPNNPKTGYENLPSTKGNTQPLSNEPIDEEVECENPFQFCKEGVRLCKTYEHQMRYDPEIWINKLHEMHRTEASKDEVEREMRRLLLSFEIDREYREGDFERSALRRRLGNLNRTPPRTPSPEPEYQPTDWDF